MYTRCQRRSLVRDVDHKASRVHMVFVRTFPGIAIADGIRPHRSNLYLAAA
jgi:hypothetical protein